jgi:hypothetical protein
MNPIHSESRSVRAGKKKYCTRGAMITRSAIAANFQMNIVAERGFALQPIPSHFYI